MHFRIDPFIESERQPKLLITSLKFPKRNTHQSNPFFFSAKIVSNPELQKNDSATTTNHLCECRTEMTIVSNFYYHLAKRSTMALKSSIKPRVKIHASTRSQRHFKVKDAMFPPLQKGQVQRKRMTNCADALYIAIVTRGFQDIRQDTSFLEFSG